MLPATTMQPDVCPALLDTTATMVVLKNVQRHRSWSLVPILQWGHCLISIYYSHHYRDATGYYNATQCITCPAGHYCPHGSAEERATSPIPCEPGTYNGDEGAGHEYNCRLCDQGRSCPLPASINSTHPCAEGKLDMFYWYCTKFTVCRWVVLQHISLI